MQKEQTASSEETWVRHFTHSSWLPAWGGNTPAQFTLTLFTGNVLHSVSGLLQCAAGGLPGTWTRSERRPILRHAERLARGHLDKTSGLLADSVILHVIRPVRPPDGTAQQIRNSVQKFDSETQDHPLHSPNLALSDFLFSPF